MKKTLISILSLILALTMIAGVFASCTTGGTGEVESSDEQDSQTPGGEDESSTPEDSKDPVAPSEHIDLIQAANGLANGVQAFFPSADRTHYSLSNTEMIMNYARSSRFDQLVESIKNHNGAAYIQNTMDVFVRMANGDSYDTFYASQSLKSAEANLYRFGYYYYQGMFEFQNFVPKEFEVLNTTEIDLKNQFSESFDIRRGKEDNNLSYTITKGATDPRIIFRKNFKYSTAEYNTLVFKAKALGNTTSVQLFINTDKTGFAQGSSIDVSLINDGEYHTYYISLFNITGYDGDLKGIRLDPNGSEGGGVAIESMTLGKADLGSVPSDLSINRHFHVYSDKMHHTIQFAVTEKTTDILEVGMLTEIEQSTVSKIIIVTDDGKTFSELNGDFAWEDVVAVGFDVTAAGIFGFILPKDEIAGKIKVELKDGTYVIEQTRTPEVDGVSGVIIPSINTEELDGHGQLKHADGVTNNGNDFYIGQRVYTDENHDFAEFLQETHFERNPLDPKRVSVSENGSDGASFLGYDAKRGIYTFKVSTPNGFASSYNNPQKNFKVNFSIRSDIDRGIYVMSAGSGGTIECATLMDEDMMLLPIPIEVIKNFSEATGERNLYNISDPTFSEAIFYIPLKQNQKQEYTIINLYQNWGNYPLKQISQIPFHCPYYHLSTGVTETNCIVPWFSTDSVTKGSSWTLPDFRSMSAPDWIGQPQHNSCGSHTWLEYTPTDGGTYLVESMRNDITSYGPTYAEVVWENLSDDGKIKVTYTHMEMPQLDENRSYYTMEYEFLSDLTINSFKDNFLFYKVTDNDGTGTYKKVGYLNENNESVVVDSNQDPEAAPEYVLGDKCPYFSFFMMPDWNRESTSAQGYANLAFLVYTSEFIIGGAEKDYNFLIRNDKDYITLTLNESGTIEFKAGDKITINAILLPWGSQQYEDDPANRIHNANTEGFTEYTYSTVLPDGTLYMDKNVRDVRENTLLNPLTVTSETDEVLKSPYLPKVRSKNGKTAEFTLSGGQNNVTVKAYGFDKLTAPKVEEYVNGEWVEYVLSSKDNPDKTGNYHYYDGYQVQYEKDGTYSYSFVTTMYDGAPRKFRISAEDDFTKWPAEQAAPEAPDYLTVYTDAKELETLVNSSIQMYGTPVVNETDTDGIFTSVYVKVENPFKESYSTFISTSNDEVSGQYLVIKYRIPSTNTESVGHFQIWASTETSTAQDAGSLTHYPVADGKWHVEVIDLAKSSLKHFKANSSGEYLTKLLRIDFFNKDFTNADTHIDIAYVGMDTDLLNICGLEQNNYKTITLVEDGISTEIDTITGKKEVKTYLDPSSGYTESTLPFASTLDFISGITANISSNSSKNGIVIRKGVTTNKDGEIVLQGWCVANGGIERYVYSIDGGKTWNNCGGGSIDAGNAIMESARKAAGGADYYFDSIEASKVNGNFQQGGTGGLKIDLSSIEESVDVVFAAVPKADTSTLILLFSFEDVTPTVESIFDESSVYSEYMPLYGSQTDSFNGVANVQSSGNMSGFPTVSGIVTNEENTLVIKGWSVIEGGASKYVWTADGGKTWHDCGGTPADAHDEMIKVGQRKTGSEFVDVPTAKINGNWQGTGLIVDLSEYKSSAETLDIYVCAVSASNAGSVIVLYHLDDVTFAN